MANPKKIPIGSRVSRFPAGTFNALVEGELRNRQPGHGGNPPIANGFAKSTVIVRLVWDGEGTLPPGSVVKLGEVIKNPTSRPEVVREGLQFRCGEPTPTDEHVAITMEPMRAGQVGYGHIPQASWALVNVTNAGHDFAKVDSGTELESDAATGFPIIWKESGTGSGKWAVIKLSAPGDTGNVIYAQAVGAVTSGDPTFTFDNAIAIVGSIPAGGTGTAQNQYAQELSDNDWVLLFQEKASDQWLTERGGESGSQVVYFEITEHKVYGDAAVLAKPVLADGTMDSGADAFYVVDEKNMYYGRAAEGGADGYRGFGLRYTDDYSEGVPGFRIISMEGPAQFLIVTLDENLASPTDCTYAEDPSVFGLPFRGRTPAPVSSVDVKAYDDIGVADGAQSGEKWILTWNETDERYCFWRKVATATSTLVIVMVRTTIAAGTINGTAITATPGVANGGATILTESAGSLSSSGVSVDAVNFSLTAITCSSSIPGLFIAQRTTWNGDDAAIIIGPFDMRNLPSFNSSDVQVPYHAASSSSFLLGGGEC
jgi:hypothetical protein